MRTDTPVVGSGPRNQVHAHSTGNRNSTAQNEYDYMMRKDLNSGFYTHVVGNGKVMQTAPTGRGAWDVGGGWNNNTYAAVELIESHMSKEEFMSDYKLYVNTLRKLAQEAEIPTTLDSSAVTGIKTHDYCTKHQPYNNSDHIDPYPYLSKWGISKEQFKKDVETGFSDQQNQNGNGVAKMFAIYWHDGKAYFFNGVSYEYISHPDAVKVLKDVYKANNGKDMPEYQWNKSAPWWVRLEQPIVNLQEVADKINDIQAKIKQLESKIK